MTIEQDIAAAIDKNLPAAVGEQLRKQLEELPRLRKNLAAQEDETKTARQKSAEWEALARKHLEELNAHQKLGERESAVLRREQAQNLNDLRVLLADERRADAVSLVHTIFRSPVMTRTVQGTVPVAVEGCPPNQYNSSGSAGYVLPGAVDTKTTESIG